MRFLLQCPFIADNKKTSSNKKEVTIKWNIWFTDVRVKPFDACINHCRWLEGMQRRIPENVCVKYDVFRAGFCGFHYYDTFFRPFKKKNSLIVMSFIIFANTNRFCWINQQCFSFFDSSVKIFRSWWENGPVSFVNLIDLFKQ